MFVSRKYTVEDFLGSFYLMFSDSRQCLLQNMVERPVEGPVEHEIPVSLMNVPIRINILAEDERHFLGEVFVRIYCEKNCSHQFNLMFKIFLKII